MEIKKFIVIFFSMVIIFCSNITAEAARKAVALMPVENISGYRDMNVAQFISDDLTVALQNSGKYSVLEREKMAMILDEQGFQNVSGDPRKSVKLGQLTGANYSVFAKVVTVNVEKNLLSKILPKSSEKGVVNGWKSKVTVDIRFVNNENGELVFAKSFAGTKTGINAEDALTSACKEVAENFFKELISNTVGRVIDIHGDEIFIDQGVDSGFRKGDTLVVFRETAPIMVGEKIVGMKTIQITKVKITEVNTEYSVCKVIFGQTGSKRAQKGDIVKRG